MAKYNLVYGHNPSRGSMSDEDPDSQLDYATAGVDIDKEDAAISKLVKTLKYR
jgi:hypothetical protein